MSAEYALVSRRIFKTRGGDDSFEHLDGLMEGSLVVRGPASDEVIERVPDDVGWASIPTEASALA
jgi:hypothetical protein